MTKHKRVSTLLKHLCQRLQQSLLGYDATSLAHTYLGSFSHPPLQILSSSVRLDGEPFCTAIFRSLQRCSIGFKSGLWLGHSRTFRYFSLPLLHRLGCVLRVVVLLDGKPSPQSEVLRTLEQIYQGSLYALLHSSLPRSWLISQSLPLKNIPTGWCCHNHASP